MSRSFARAVGVLAVTTGIVAGVGACPSGDDPAPERCPSDLPPSCPTPPPSFSRDVTPVFARVCWGCHADGGVATAKRDFGTYDAIHAQRSPILNQLYACKMPPADAGAPTSEERKTLLAWLVCDAPNN